MTTQENLELQIRTYNAAYRVGEPLCSDETYDRLMDELKTNFPTSELLKKAVLDTVKGPRKESLPMPMYSLDKYKSIEDLFKWAKSKGLSPETTVVVTAKYDGISILVDECTKECWTRGDGEVGQRSNLHYRKMAGFSEGCERFFSIGEAIMSKKNFERFKDKYANPRNFVAGLFNRDIPSDDLQYVDHIRYGMSMEVDKGYQLNILDTFNHVPVMSATVRLGSLSEDVLNAFYDKWSKDYQIDGLVIDVWDEKIRKQLGREENMNPAFAVAYKNPEWNSAETVRVTGITWKTSKQGKMKPVIQIEPTELGGVIVTNVAGYNAKYIFDNNIAIDSIIRVVRSGDVIPKHIETVHFDRNQVEELADVVTECQCCLEPTKWDETMTELVCTNPNCQERNIGKLVHFFTTLGIEDFGEPSITAFYNQGYRTAISILRMDYIDIADQIVGYGDASARNLTKQFNNLKLVGVPFARLLTALDIMEGKLGEKMIQSILDNTTDLTHTKLIDLIKIKGISDITAAAFLKGMNEYFYIQDIVDYVKLSYISTPKAEVKGNKYEGWKICFTGCRPTKEQENEITEQGGEVVSGVSKNTTHLIVKDTSTTTMSSSKALKALELGIYILPLNKL